RVLIWYFAPADPPFEWPPSSATPRTGSLLNAIHWKLYDAAIDSRFDGVASSPPRRSAMRAPMRRKGTPASAGSSVVGDFEYDCCANNSMCGVSWRRPDTFNDWS